MRFRRLKDLVGAVALLAVVALPLPAQENRFEHSIDSQHPEEGRPFTVQLPVSYWSNSEFAYPVLYLLDGEVNLGYSLAVTEFLADNGVIPELIIVGVHSGATRGRDYMPPNPSGSGQSGEADQFLDFLELELIPFIEKKYRAAPLRLISGHSLGGLLITHAMVTRADLFRGYIAQSPYVEETFGPPLLDRVEERLTNEPDLDAFYYVNVGDEPKLMPNFERLQRLLGAAESDSFTWHSDHHNGESHMTTRLVGLYAGLEGFFKRSWRLPSAALGDTGFAGLESHLAALSADYGYPMMYGEREFQEATQHFFAQRDIESATEAARLYARHHTESPLAQFLLASALASGGDREGGIEAIDAAIRLYEADPLPRLKPVYDNMQVLRGRLSGS